MNHRKNLRSILEKISLNNPALEAGLRSIWGWSVFYMKEKFCISMYTASFPCFSLAITRPSKVLSAHFRRIFMFKDRKEKMNWFTKFLGFTRSLEITRLVEFTVGNLAPYLTTAKI